MKKYRILQRITGFHYIHHVYYGFGYKFPLLEVGYFKRYGIKRTKIGRLKDAKGLPINREYHDCTATGVY